jgi:arylsulfatase A
MKPTRCLGMLLLFLCGLAAPRAWSADAPTRPNIVFLLADDLGYGDLGCYGQKKIHTPNLDRLAADGMRLTTHYAGNCVCAPSRCVLMTGLHPGHAHIRDNRRAEGFPEGQEPVPPNYLTLLRTLKKLGYTNGAFGKWGLGPFGSSGDPLRQGLDRFFGYNCQGVAHNYYPKNLWDNDRQIELDNPAFSAHQKMPAGADPDAPASYARYRGKDYAPDRISRQALRFLRENKERPFFLYYPTTIPHLALQVPDEALKEYQGKFAEQPYRGERDYLPQRTPHAAYAAMVTRLDREVGWLLDALRELKLEERTIVIFTSDNGPLFDKYGGTDTDFFHSAGDFRGRKGSLYEGGVRVPCLVRWKGHIAAGKTDPRTTGFEDWLPTLLELIGATEAIPAGVDGVSFAPTLLGKSQKPRPFLYREYPSDGGQQFVRVGQWKAIRTGLNGKKDKLQPGPIELYDLDKDPAETTNAAARHADLVARLASILREQHVQSRIFPLRALDGPAR